MHYFYYFQIYHCESPVQDNAIRITTKTKKRAYTHVYMQMEKDTHSFRTFPEIVDKIKEKGNKWK